MKHFYRYEAVEYASLASDGDYTTNSFPNPQLELRVYNLHKETPKGYWIGYGNYKPEMLRGNSRWVSKTAKKRHAYPTKEEAKTNFIKRSERRIKILKAQLFSTQMALSKAINV
jgi:hypothetical protein